MDFLVSSCFPHSRWFCPTPCYSHPFARLLENIRFSNPCIHSCLLHFKQLGTFHICHRAAVMQAPNIVNFAVATSICVMFFQGTETDIRVRHFEEIAEACLRLLEFLGRPPFLKSIFDLWVTTTAALAQLERMLFPNDQVQTPTHLAAPPAWRPLSAVCEPAFEGHHALIQRALRHLEQFRAWFSNAYDIYLHHETLHMLDDSILLLQSVEHFIQLQPAPAEPARAEVPDSTGGVAVAPTATPEQAPAFSDPWLDDESGITWLTWHSFDEKLFGFRQIQLDGSCKEFYVMVLKPRSLVTV